MNMEVIVYVDIWHFQDEPRISKNIGHQQYQFSAPSDILRGETEIQVSNTVNVFVPDIVD